ncbi:MULTISPECIES: phosphoserine phosphatase SerB [unclassified Colwellia]|uniref:phosphoserine phosphatase SerB n=1 Tax=unclassified Colwellia TaxID=196834 RepID=UPI0028704306|nr:MULTISPECIES: phosphoserine phosphatase SerB [unclassified Colwellia]
MTIQKKSVSLDSIQHLNLTQWLPVDASSNNIAIAFEKAQQAFVLFDNNNLSTPTNSSETLELIVFGDLKIMTLVNLLSECELTLHCLHKINQRNNATSYRFGVQVKDIKQARDRLASFNISEQIESALLLNAPTLSIPGLLVMDMDSTTIKIECIDEIAALAGVGEEVAAVTELAMLGELDFSQSLHQRVAKLEHAPEKILAQVASNIPLMEGLETLVSELKKHHWRVAIASGGFTYFADHLKEMLSLDAAVANVLEIKNNLLTGKVLGEVIDAKAKADCLIKLKNEFNIAPTQTVAMGDGANDLVMMAAAHLGVAFHAKPLVLAQADTCITTSGLDCLLHWLK